MHSIAFLTQSFKRSSPKDLENLKPIHPSGPFVRVKTTTGHDLVVRHCQNPKKAQHIIELHAFGYLPNNADNEIDSIGAFFVAEYLNLSGSLNANAQVSLAHKLAALHDPKNGPAERNLGFPDNMWENSTIPFLLGGLDIDPVPIHGDLWSGNAGVDTKIGPVIFDPSSVYAHNELGMMCLFGGFSSKFFDTYHKIRPKLQPYYEQRQDLYKLYHLLNHNLLFGESYKSSSLQTMKDLFAFVQKQTKKGNTESKEE
ncbi:Fructosamine kinase-domain-containing protein [Chytridium lagenaria]|nr:Fructosamine kinase-domain-containing protein [Chytridium lagenaria]